MELASGKTLSTFGLVMINVIAICSLRTLPFSATFGWQLIPLYLIAACCFLLPIAIISSFFASRFPQRGGVYVWVRESLGLRLGFLAIWLQWLYNLLWYPTAMVFVVETFFYGFGINASRLELMLLVTGLFWMITLANCFGMRISGFISTAGAVIGTIVPIMLLIGLALFWIHGGQKIGISQGQNWTNLLPLTVNLLFGLMGIEMSCVHANDVKQPRKSYPRALIISSCLIVILLAVSSLAIAIVVPHETLNVVNGANQAFVTMLNYAGAPFLKSYVMSLISIGGLACIGAWIIGPSKGLFVASTDGCLPKFLAKTNIYEVPQRLLIIQAGLVSLLCLFYLYMPSLEQAYETLSIATSQLALVAYLVLIIAAIKMRNTKITGYETFGGRNAYTLFCLIGLIATIIAFTFGFQLPPSLHINVYKYDLLLIAGMSLAILPVFLVSKE